MSRLRKPYRCPVCDGHGWVPAGFYSKDPEPSSCRPCEGKGIVWTPFAPLDALFSPEGKVYTALLSEGGVERYISQATTYLGLCEALLSNRTNWGVAK